MRKLVLDLILGENSDKPDDSGRSTVIEAKGVVPFIPEGDTQGGVMVSPGWRIHGQDTFASIPGVHGELGTFSSGGSVGEPANPASASAFYRGVRIAGATPPGYNGTVIMALYSGEGVGDPKLGEGLGVYHEVWGNDIRAGEKIAWDVETDEGDLDEALSKATAIMLRATTWWPLYDIAESELTGSIDPSDDFAGVEGLYLEDNASMTFTDDGITGFATFATFDNTDSDSALGQRPWVEDVVD